MLYALVRSILFLLPPEMAHHFSFGALRVAASIPPARAAMRKLCSTESPELRVEALGLVFSSPVGLAAGFDKNAEGYEALGVLGFGHVEVGTITAVPQPGNPRPRMFRLALDRALINRMGFNNDGANAVAARLGSSQRKPGKSVVVGVNIGKSKVAPEEDAIVDYRASTRELANHADYFVVNVSSPNTPGLRNLQAIEKLRPLLVAVRKELDETCPARRVPLLVKIAPDLSNDDILDVADLALELGLDGIIATNTTIGRQGLKTPASSVTAMGGGGLSGAPLRQRSLEVVRLLRSRVGDRLTIIAVGGIETGQDAWERVQAGATLVQMYTGFIYGGPFAPSAIARDLAARAKAAGFATVQSAVGSERVE